MLLLPAIASSTTKIIFHTISIYIVPKIGTVLPMTTPLTHPNPTNPTITLKLFAAYQDAVGQAELTQTIAPETTIAALFTLKRFKSQGE